MFALNMIKKIFSVVLLLLVSTLQAQYTDVINSNKPGFSESPYSVGTGVYQFESSIFHRGTSAIPTFSNPRATGLELHYRMGLLDEYLEVNLTTSLQQNEFAFVNVFESSRSEFGLGQFTLGAKYLVYKPKYQDRSKEIRSWKKRHSFDWSRWIPHVAVYGGLNFGSFLSDFHERGGITPKIGVLLQNEFSHKLNVVTNIHYNYIGGYLPELSYVVTGTYNFTDKWSGFAEHQALFNKQENQSNLGVGAAYLFNKNLQINSSLRATFQDNSTGIYTSVGVSYRINKHIDKYTELDEFGNKIEGDDVQTYNKGFFGRLIDKIKNLFKKKDKNSPQLEEEKTEEELEKKEEGRKRTRQKSVLDDITKKDKKAKKKTTKEKEKAAKKKKRAEEKAKKKQEKEKLKEEKRKKKEQEKLEKEIKKLEEELKKEEEKEKKEKEKEDEKKEKKKKDDE
ncbi:putative Outer membrane beta-barrel porin/alpha-amylase [Tenacibaculum sp. 190524A05c]|uniref:Outer membrane beta-barrel porin/alpha-amylase n=2 Tax=Tenacibaculum platacis TaxID=3137852 RepID=A0ABM9P622_9FLAO